MVHSKGRLLLHTGHGSSSHTHTQKLDARGGVDMPYWHCTAFKSRTVAAQHKCQETMKLIRHKRKTRRKMAALRTGVAEIGSQLAMQSLLQFGTSPMVASTAVCCAVGGAADLVQNLL